MKQALSILFSQKFARVTACLFLFGLGFFWIINATGMRHLADNLIAAYLVLWGLFAFVSGLPRAEIGKRFVLMTATIGCLLLLLEVPVWVGLLDYRRVFAIMEGFNTWDQYGFVVADELLWLHPPHHQLHVKYTRGNLGEYLCLPHNPPREYDLRYDRNGFRNDSDLESADIVVVGDSFVESPMLARSTLLTSILTELENSTVANLGMSGYGPQQELGVLKRHALNLHPKTILWFFYEGNDLQDAQAYEEKAAGLPKERNPIYWHFQRSFTRSALRALLRVSRGCVPSREVEQRYGLVRDHQGEEHRKYFANPVLPLSASDIRALETVKSVLVEAYRLCQEHSIQFIVVFGPTEYRVYNGLPNVTSVSKEVQKWVINDLPERLRAIVADISPDIEYVDLTPTFKSEAARGTLVFLDDDTHWSPDGHRIAAQAVHETLSRRIARAVR